MPAPFLKDFDKDVTDFFKKYYVEGTKGFKFESKVKPSDRTVYINPGYEKGVFTVNFQYDDKAHFLKSKVALANNDTLVPKITCEKGSNKIELTETIKVNKIREYAGEFVHEFKDKVISLYTKTSFSANSNCNTDLYFSAAASKELTLGCHASFSASTRQLLGYKAGARFSCCPSNLISATYDNNGAISVAVLASLADILPEQIKKCGGLIAVGRLNHNTKGSIVDLGLQGACPKTGAQWRLKGGLSGNYGFALTKMFKGATVTLGGEGKVGKFDSPFAPGKLSVTVVAE